MKIKKVLPLVLFVLTLIGTGIAAALCRYALAGEIFIVGALLSLAARWLFFGEKTLQTKTDEIAEEAKKDPHEE